MQTGVNWVSVPLCGKQKDTYVVAAFLWLAHPPTEIGVDGQNEDLDRDTAVELDGIDVELLRRVDLDHLLRVRVACMRIRSLV